MAVLSRVREWVGRYGPAEVLSTVVTLLAALAARHERLHQVAAALLATWAGNLVYYGLVLGRDIQQARRQLASEGRRYTFRTFGRNVRALVVEFGPAEALDGLVVRPGLMYWGPRWLGNLTWGVLLGKFAADLCFYAPAILSYELSKRRLRRF